MASLVTLNQIKQIVNAIKTIVDKKATKGSDASFNSVTTGDVWIHSTFNEDENTLSCTLEGMKEYRKGKVDIDIPYNGQSGKVLVSTDGNTIADTITVNNLADNGRAGIGNTQPTYYCLPNAPSSAKMLANSAGPEGGGVILTTRNRSYALANVSKSDVEPNIIFVFENTYYRITGLSDIVFAFPDINIKATKVDECWLDITFPDDVSPSVGYNGYTDVVWVPSMPEWSELAGRRIQIHIIGGVATYTTIPN